MGIAIFTVSALFSPLQGLVNWFLPQEPQGLRPLAASPAQRFGEASGRAGRPAHAGGRPAADMPARAARPLRVLRVVEPGSARAGAGRMVISGRMADVCAELDRLAALEAQSLH